MQTLYSLKRNIQIKIKEKNYVNFLLAHIIYNGQNLVEITFICSSQA